MEEVQCDANTTLIELTRIGRYETGIFNRSASESVTYDPSFQQLYIANNSAGTIDVVDIRDPLIPTLRTTIDVTPFGANATSVAFNRKRGILAATVEQSDRQELGTLLFFGPDETLLSTVVVGAAPDMVTFTPDGLTALVANEGEASNSYLNDPEGSISIADISGAIKHLTQDDVTTVDLKFFNDVPLDAGIRIFGPAATVAQDLEPEYITVDPDGKTAWVSFQENNAIGQIDIETATVTKLIGLGFKDHNIAGNGLDASDKDGTIAIRNWPVKGMYQPDSIASYYVNGNTWLVTANEGASRDSDGFDEEARVGDVDLDRKAFPNADEIRDPKQLGRLKITVTKGDVDNDGDFDELYAYGARSFSIWTSSGKLLFDSGEDFERIVSESIPKSFHSDNTSNNTFDTRSDNKGVEPEGLSIGIVNGCHHAFIGLERIGGIMVYNISEPKNPTFVQYINDRDFSGDAMKGEAGDLGPEGLLFIPSGDSPIGVPLLVVANAISGTTSIYRID